MVERRWVRILTMSACLGVAFSLQGGAPGFADTPAAQAGPAAVASDLDSPAQLVASVAMPW